MHNLSSALSYLHSINICHRDIKPENLLVCQHKADHMQTDARGSKTLKLGDFGLAVELKSGEKLYTVCGTPNYVAPEILAETGYDHKVDVWAAGVIAYVLLCGFPPFVSPDNDQDELFDQILSGRFEFSSPHWDDVSLSAQQLILHMLQVDQSKRLSAHEVFEHPWVNVSPDIIYYTCYSYSITSTTIPYYQSWWARCLEESTGTHDWMPGHHDDDWNEWMNLLFSLSLPPFIPSDHH